MNVSWVVFFLHVLRLIQTNVALTNEHNELCDGGKDGRSVMEARIESCISVFIKIIEVRTVSGRQSERE